MQLTIPHDHFAPYQIQCATGEESSSDTPISIGGDQRPDFLYSLLVIRPDFKGDFFI